MLGDSGGECNCWRGSLEWLLTSLFLWSWKRRASPPPSEDWRVGWGERLPRGAGAQQKSSSQILRVSSGAFTV